MFKKIRQLLFNDETKYGLEVQENKEAVARYNRHVLSLTFMAGLVLFSVLFLLSYFSHYNDKMLLWYFIAVVFCAAIYGLLKIIRAKYIISFAYVSFFLAFIYSALVSILAQKEQTSVIVLMFLVLFSLVLIDLPLRMNVFIVIVGALYITAIIIFKSVPIMLEEVKDVLIFAVVSIICGTFSRRRFILNMVLRNRYEKFAYFDYLLGIHSRRKLYEDIDKSETAKPEETIKGVAMVDVDDFKSYNDSFGHKAGDECLRRIGVSLREFERKYGVTVYRYGGEEFVIITLKHSPTEFFNICEQLRLGIYEKNIVRSDTAIPRVTVSIGVAIPCDPQHVKYSLLLDKADMALYRVKATGKNAVRMYDGTEKFTKIEENGDSAD